MVEPPSKETIVEAYLSEKPTVATSRDIVKSIAEKYGLKDTKVRSVLVSANVYIAQVKREMRSPPQRGLRLLIALTQIVLP